MLKAFDRDYFVALILLMPGFLSRQIVQYFAVGKPGGGEFEAIATSLAFSLVDVTLAATAWHGSHWLLRKIRGVDLPKPSAAGLSPGFVVVLLIVAVGVGAFASWSERNGMIYHVAKPTSQVSSARPWVTLWDQCRTVWARVTLSDKRIYFGYVMYHSIDQDITELVLNRVHRESVEGKRERVKAERVLLFGKDIVSVEVIPAAGSEGCSDKERL